MKKVINFTKLRWMFLITSLIIIVCGSLYTFILKDGFNFGIDFKPGVILQFEVDQAEKQEIEDALATLDANVQKVSGGEYFNIRISDEEDMEDFQRIMENKVKSILVDAFGSTRVYHQSTDYVGAGMSSKISTGTFLWTGIALILILVYVWIRFKFNYAVSSILAIFHDVMILLVFIGVFQLEFSAATIAALLTIIGYSLNDTIVIFDRIRENRGIVKDKTFEEIVNLSITQSLSRTLITSLTTLVAMLSVFILASGPIKIFALNIIVGVIVGTYSSIFIASNVLISWQNRHARKAHDKQVSKSTGGELTQQQVAAKNVPEPVKMSAEEIAEATAKRKKQKAKKKKKRK